jgi:PAS domain S-box-containing protein
MLLVLYKVDDLVVDIRDPLVTTYLLFIILTVIIFIASVPLLIIYLAYKPISKIKFTVSNIDEAVKFTSVINEIDLIYSYLKDIHDRLQDCKKQSAIKSAEYELQQKTFIDFVDFAIIGVDRSQTVTIWNKKARGVTGISCNEAIGHSLAEFLPSKQHVIFHKNRIEQIFNAKNYGYILKNQHITFNLKTITVNALLTVCLVHDNLVIAFVEDLEDALRETYINNAYEVLNFSDITIFSIKAVSLDTIYISKSVEKLLGYSYLTIYEKGMLSLVKEKHQEKFRNAIDILVCRGSETTSVTERIELIDVAGETIYAEIFFYPIKDKNNLATTVQGIIKNISLQVNHQRLLERYNKELQYAVEIKTKELSITNEKLQVANELLITLQRQVNNNILSIVEMDVKE